ncbi:hypothetical protein I6N90_09705 [Paenibacillus sp. GSMTC-2017]|uniref:YqhR family membrane protein n=1 Tax=Paenibacillus sp. GSMTC-2017 TaxID=2794350 RepID=UPI0018D80A17|nr:YqhR family membrane protein [Paenibacillus sp. GSMTC-2017]MBH5318081.1 hypothetical protein [Paenibacillus sp. GSMTC-2017]
MQHQSKKGSGKARIHKTNPWLFALKIGFFAGLIWGVIRWLSYGMKFTTVVPGFLLDSFLRHSFLKTSWGIVAGIGAFIVFSIAAAFIYIAVLRKCKGPWPGILYGLAWWIILFIGVGPFVGMMEWITKLGWNTIYTEICLFLLWGVFIGYSIAFEFTDEASREPIAAKS